MARDITPRQKKFVQEYLRSGDATDAAIAAGYSAKSAASTASKTLKMPGVIEYRRELEKKLFDEMGISKAWIGRRLVEIVERCTQKTPVLEWNPETRQKEPNGFWEFDANGAIRALHELAEHMDFAEGEQSAAESYMAAGVTDPAWQGRGLARYLIVGLANELAAERAVRFACFPALCGFYARLGFLQIGKIQHYTTDWNTT